MIRKSDTYWAPKSLDPPIQRMIAIDKEHHRLLSNFVEKRQIEVELITYVTEGLYPTYILHADDGDLVVHIKDGEVVGEPENQDVLL